MKVYHNNEKNLNKRNEPFFKKMVHYVISFGISGVIALVYYLIASFFSYNANYKNINAKLVNWFIKIIYFLNSFLLRKNIFKAFDTEELPKNGCFMIFNHVNEFEYPYDFYFGQGVPLFDMGVKKLGPLYPAMTRLGIALRSGKELKKSLEEVEEYLKITNIIFYPEGERTFSDRPKIYKRGLLKLVYEGKYRIIIFYKGGMEKLNDNLFYCKSEIIESKNFKTFDDFYSFIIEKNRSYYELMKTKN